MSDPDNLSHQTAAEIGDPSNDVFASAASVWEIVIKESIGKLKLPAPAGRWLLPAVHSAGIETINVTAEHALGAASLPLHHKDPFDRFLIAQARIETLVLVSADRIFFPIRNRNTRWVTACHSPLEGVHRVLPAVGSGP